MFVRPATFADAAGLARVHVAAWRSAYVGVMPDAYLAELDEARFERGWVRALEEAVSTVLVGAVDDAVQGFATFGAARDEGPAASRQLYAFNLHPIAFGSGLAVALHQEVIAALRDAGHESAYLWVAELNPRARRFYEREGWEPDGASHMEEFGGAPLTETRYIRGIS
ncbi:N-acetyltransferase family protein [Demequina sp.]|uniref:GNAT family N-acetyltransferase n=1 Tax=Demequina sp. TaxID=2050685 RepID=UPI003D0A767B